MKLLFWNCGGMACTLAINSLRAMIQDHNPDCLYIMESKVCENVASSILNRLGYYYSVFVPPIGAKGGLVLSWRAGCPLSVLCKNGNVIHFSPISLFSAPLCMASLT